MTQILKLTSPSSRECISVSIALTSLVRYKGGGSTLLRIGDCLRIKFAVFGAIQVFLPVLFFSGCQTTFVQPKQTQPAAYLKLEAQSSTFSAFFDKSCTDEVGTGILKPENDGGDLIRLQAGKTLFIRAQDKNLAVARDNRSAILWTCTNLISFTPVENSTYRLVHTLKNSRGACVLSLIDVTNKSTPKSFNFHSMTPGCGGRDRVAEGNAAFANGHYLAAYNIFADLTIGDDTDNLQKALERVRSEPKLREASEVSIREITSDIKLRIDDSQEFK